MTARAASLAAAAIVAALGVLASPGCADETHPELPVDQASLQTASAPAPAAAPAPERNAETPSQALERIYKDALLPEDHGALRGDFNGDGSEDLAILVRPVPSRIRALNDEFANWIIRDAESRPDPSKPRPAVQPDDILLAVIHGYGQEGWRHPQARQSFLIRHANAAHMEVRAAIQVIPAAPGRSVVGDVITGVKGGKPGFLLWIGSRYVWHSGAAGLIRSSDPE